MHIQFQFEKEENRVKGLAFHATKPLLAVGLHNGNLEVWDVEAKVKLLANESVHNGPIRSVDFHPTQCHMLCSGGDDRVVRVWSIEHDTIVVYPPSCDISYSSSASRGIKSPVICASLAGHTDYVRSTQFHPTFPWILSSSDDQTIRIWDWSSRSCLVVCHGHEHYVMCARFHPTANCIVSASLDSSIRVWDMTNLVTAYSRTNTSQTTEIFDAITNKLEGKVTVRRVIEAHDKGVNWVCLHPTESLFVSASDDRTIRLWSADYENDDFREIGCIREHTQNVTCCVFDTAETMMSCGEDGDVCLWDLENKRQIVCSLGNQKLSCNSFKKTHRERYWGIAVHKKLPYVAAGNDFGFDVFCHSTLFPVCHFSLGLSCLTFFESREMKRVVFQDNEIIPSTKPLKRFKKTSDFSTPRRIDVSLDGNSCVYAFSSLVDSNQGSFYAVHRLANGSDKSSARKESFMLIRDCSGMPVFISHDTFAHIDGSQSIALKNVDCELLRTISNDVIQLHLRSRHGESMLVRSINRLHSSSTGDSVILECSTTQGLLWCRINVETEHIFASRIFDQVNEAPKYAVWKNFGSFSFVLIVFQTKFLVCDADLSTVSIFRTHAVTIDSVLFDSGNFMGSSSSNDEKQSRIVYFTAGNQLFYGIVPSGEVDVLKSFPSRIQLLDGNIDDGRFVFSAPTKGSNSDIFCTTEEPLNTETEICRIGDGIFRVFIDLRVFKLDILSKYCPLSLVDEFTESLSQATLPFFIVKRIVDGPLPAKYTLRLLRTLGETCGRFQKVQTWLFELACKFLDVHFAYDRLVNLVKLAELGASVPVESDQFQTMWKALAELSVDVGELDVARKCYGKLSLKNIPPWASVLLMTDHNRNDTVTEKELFHSVLHDLLAGKAEQAAESLEKLGLADLAEKCCQNALFVNTNENTLIESCTRGTDQHKPTFQLGEYYTAHEETIHQAITEETTVSTVADTADLLNISFHEMPRPKDDVVDPLDFIFDSSESE